MIDIIDRLSDIEYLAVIRNRWLMAVDKECNTNDIIQKIPLNSICLIKELSNGEYRFYSSSGCYLSYWGAQELDHIVSILENYRAFRENIGF